MTDEDVVKTLARRFFWPGSEPEDVEQEAWFALERGRSKFDAARGRKWSSWAWVCVESHLREVRRRERFRRPQFAEMFDVHPSLDDLVDRVEARRLLRHCLEADLPPKEREAVDRILVGLPCPRDGRWLDTALQRARPKLLAAA